MAKKKNKAEKFVVNATKNIAPRFASDEAWRAAHEIFTDKGKKIPPEYEKAIEKYAPFIPFSR